MSDKKRFEIKQGFGFSAVKRSFLAFLVGAVLITMYFVNDVKSGDLEPAYLLWVAGFFMLIGFMALFFRRRIVIDKEQQSIKSCWSILFYQSEANYPMEYLVGLYLQIGHKPKMHDENPSNDERAFYLMLNEKGSGGKEDESFYLLIYRTSHKGRMDSYITKVSDFLGMESKVIDYRTGIDAVLSNYIESELDR